MTINMKAFFSKNRIKPGDILIIFLIIIISITGFISMTKRNNGDIIARIVQSGNITHTINLNEVKEPYKIVIEKPYHEIILVENGRIRFLESDCPDKVCVNTGWIHRPGQGAVCLPANIYIKLTGEDDLGIDVELR
jgi:hypothetical protein